VKAVIDQEGIIALSDAQEENNLVKSDASF
jgi:hypothetical protein